MSQPQPPPLLRHLSKLLRPVVALDRRVLQTRPQVLADGENVAAGVGKVRHDQEQLVPGLPQAHHHAGLREAIRGELPGQPLNPVVYPLHPGDEAGGGVLAGVGGEKPVLIGEDDQEVSVHQVGHHGREVVVIAEGGPLQLLHRHHIVLVDDAQHP